MSSKSDHDIGCDFQLTSSFFKNVIDNSPDYIFVKNQDLHIIEINATMLKVLGISKKEALGKDLYKHFKVKDVDRFQATDYEAFDKGYSELMGDVVFPSLGLRRVQTKKIVFEAADSEKYLICLCRDLTDFAQKEVELEYAHKFLKKVIDAIPDYVFVKDEALRICLANKAFLSLYNKPEEQIVGTTTIEDYPEEQARVFIEQDKLALEKGYTETLEDITAPSGDRLILSTKKIGFNSSSGERFLLGVAQDITEQTLFEKFLENIYKVSTSAKISLTEKMQKILVGGLEYLGLDFGIISEIKGDKYKILYAVSPADELKPGAEFDFADTYCVKTFKSEDVVTYHYAKESEIAKHPCYKKFQLEAYVGSSIYLDGVSYGTVNFSSARQRKPFTEFEKSFIRLISHWIGNELTREKALNRLKKYNKQLEQKNEELDEFSYITSHDLKQPLRGISAYADILVEDCSDKLDEDSVKRLETISDLARRMDMLTDSLLHYSRLGREAIIREPIALDDIVMDIQARLGDQDTSIETDGVLPVVMCDRKKVEELIYNLVENGIRYNDSPSKQIVIGCLNECPEAPGQQVIFVKDNGFGLDEDEIKQVFKPFNRMHAESAESKSAGYGLNIAKKIVECHNGKIWLRSNKKNGSTFYFTLTHDD